MASEVRWEDFEKLHVVRKIRNIIEKRWHIQLNFTDAAGYLRNVEKGSFFKPQTPACIAIAASTAGFKGCLATVRALTVKPAVGKTSPQTCHAGFSALSFPITVEGEFLGSIFADGFILKESAEQQRAQIKKYLYEAEHEAASIEAMIQAIPVLSEFELTFLAELLSALTEEVIVVYKALQQSKDRLGSLQTQLEDRYSFGAMVGKSPAMLQIYRLIERLGEVDSIVLIQGENGTGKELIARALHFNSVRKERKFLAVNCAAFNENILESELFGHVKGSFTNAIKDRVGLFEAAGNGTLFLDEIGDISLSMQVRLLRVLQEGVFTPLGGNSEKKTHARIIAATNRDLLAMIKQGTFREDLYYRLNVINLTVPPLRDRREDIPLLINGFLKKQASKLAQSPKRLSHAVLAQLLDYSWPGNVRELENELERLVVLGKDAEILTEENISPRILASPREPMATKVSMEVLSDGPRDLKTVLAGVEKQLIMLGLARHQGNKSRLALELGISRANLISKVAKYGLG